jgi:hypothetical protein
MSGYGDEALLGYGKMCCADGNSVLHNWVIFHGIYGWINSRYLVSNISLQILRTQDG